MDPSRLAALGMNTVSRVSFHLVRGSCGGSALAAASPLPAVAAAETPALLRAPASAAPSKVIVNSNSAVTTSSLPRPTQSKQDAPTKPPCSGPSVKKPAQKTEQVYFEDSWKFDLEGSSIVEACIGSEPPKDAPGGHVKLSIVLDRTIFHPQGGGQPSDIGELSCQGLPTVGVSFVSMRKEDAAVIHDCVVERAHADAWVAASAAGGQGAHSKVSCRVDEQKRRLFARLHSAGHLLDAAVQAADLRWIPGKGFHFADGPYVEYLLNDNSKKIDMKKAQEKDALVGQIQAQMDRLTSAGGPVLVEFKDGVRHVSMAGEECPCGGTHVKDFAEIGKVEIKKLQAKQGNMRLSYALGA
eukprot:TRINITY_DN58120_c0_g1_i1.p1 TRINITY_DN58120_c0_g1~~TRINITY_DN58120_c0_g1_i1.p1  ORF type:complete len:382 (+),score=63.50 TRINITY_DN58120_c0_g1_i1:82-1146(+)